MTKSRKNNNKNRTARKGGSSQPRQFDSNIRMRHTYRFVSTNATVFGISNDDILGAMGTECTVASTSANALFGSFKVHSVEVWSPPANQGGATTCSVNWAGGVNSPSVEVSDTTVSVSMPAHIFAVPPKGATASFWQVSSATALFNISAPPGSVVDVDVEGVLWDEDTGITRKTYAITIGTLGFVYYLALDGFASNLIIPVSLTSTH
jgi:hypothetical protein